MDAILWALKLLLLVACHAHSTGVNDVVLIAGPAAQNANGSAKSEEVTTVTPGTTTTKMPPATYNGTCDGGVGGEVDIDAILGTVGIPRCIDACTQGLRATLGQFLHFQDTLERIGELCKQFEQAKKCVHNEERCPNVHVFDAVASGIASLCGEQKQQFMRKNGKCLGQNLDTAGKECEQKCGFVCALAQFSHRSDLHAAGLLHLLDVINHASGPLCTSGGCFLECFRERVNAACAHGGGVITDALLRPFYQLAAFVKNGGTAIREFVTNKLPPECQYLIKKDSLDKMVNPNKH